MRQPRIRLTALSVERLNKPGRYADGNGLYLQIGPTGTKSWIFRYSSQGRYRLMGLGSTRFRTLAQARDKVIELRGLWLNGSDPLEAKKSGQRAALIKQAKLITFDQCAKELIANKTFSNLKHRAQWISTLETYASPVFGSFPVQDVDTQLVIKSLQPIWKRVPETASRVRGRIESVLAYATANGFRAGENPARWRGHLDAVFSKRTEIAPIEHMAALPWREIPQFMKELRAKKSHSARAVELMILTGLRPGETIAAQKSEFDLNQGVWTVPAIRMKKRVEHRIPLSPRAIEIVKELSVCPGNFLFPGLRNPNQAMSTNAMLKLNQEMRPANDITSHGFRSAFRDWASECTEYPREVCEAALAHAIKNKVEAAYRRGDLFLKRTSLMLDWERYCNSEPIAPKDVTSIQNARDKIRQGVGSP